MDSLLWTAGSGFAFAMATLLQDAGPRLSRFEWFFGLTLFTGLYGFAVFAIGQSIATA